MKKYNYSYRHFYWDKIYFDGEYHSSLRQKLRPNTLERYYTKKTMAFSSSFIEKTIEIDTTTILKNKNTDLFKTNNKFLSSFPRSGNGWVRLIFACAILELNDIDVNSINIVKKKTSNGKGYICLNSKEMSFDLEDIFPDMYALGTRVNEDKRDSDLKSLNISTMLIKTHNIVSCSSQKVVFLFREPLSCLTSASLLLNGEQINANPKEINSTIQYLVKFYSQLLDYYLEQKKQYPHNCFFIHHGSLSTQVGISHFVHALKFIEIDVPENTVKKILAKFPLKSGYDKTLAQYVTKNTIALVNDAIKDKYEKALSVCQKQTQL